MERSPVQQATNHKASRSPSIRPPFPLSRAGIAMPASVDKPVTCSDYWEPQGSDYQEPKVRTIRNLNRPQTRRIAGLQPLLTILTTILTGLLLTSSDPRAAPQRYGWRRHRALLHYLRQLACPHKTMRNDGDEHPFILLSMRQSVNSTPSCCDP